MNTKQRAKMNADIKKHGEELQRFFGLKGDPVKLCKQLRTLEHKARRLALDYCNGTGGVTTDNWQEKCEPILKRVREILKPENADVEIFLNGDARGYALKIRFDDTDARKDEIYHDWGNYGIIAPDFTPQD